MPGFDGTGPFGCGPLTGRGMGYCVGPRVGFGRGFGRGLGRRFGRGFVRGFGSDWFYDGPGIGYVQMMQPVRPQMRKADLQEYAAFLKDEINAIKEELKHIEETLGSESAKNE